MLLRWNSIDRKYTLTVMADDFSDLRQEYRHVPLLEQDANADPIEQFKDWFGQAVDYGVPLPNAMALATATRDGKPKVRFVLLKDISDKGFSFYTHSVSAKGREMAENPAVALVFYWTQMHRQVRVEGRAHMLPDEEADAYFDSRPHDSRLAVWVADQSVEVESREFLESRMAEIAEQYPGESVPRPATWAGYRVVPDSIEFWQGRESRLHDRLLYTREGEGWKIVRLAP